MRNRIILMILVVFLAECSMKRMSIPSDLPVPPATNGVHARAESPSCTGLASSDALPRNKLRHTMSCFQHAA